MMKVERAHEFKEILHECFASDDALISTWHIHAGFGLEACVEKTHSDLTRYQVDIYRVSLGDKLVGYFGRECLPGHKFLSGFMIKPAFRTKEGKAEFWKLVCEQFQHEPFLVGLYKKNIPAIKFIRSLRGHFVCEIDDACFYRVGA